MRLQMDLAGEELALVQKRAGVSTVRLRAGFVEEQLSLASGHHVHRGNKRCRVTGSAADQSLEPVRRRDLVRRGASPDTHRVSGPGDGKAINLGRSRNRHDARVR